MDNYSVVDQVFGPRQELGPGDRILKSGVLVCKDHWHAVSIVGVLVCGVWLMIN